ncbi:MAG: PhzF family phenazine biosynthesis protein [candidate division KSB1 bacterium]|nr:PhzF family phenazine biosynthesis protein [candidate division KSB1 bacterium]MDZ7386195.1 PhzF family phenazine biosynthesis protein [candidate division KSB1 bacterium]MDZ7391713.1 PhzF family phenazine biosynthesis protein [candidate division KSB1 bacterium]MDZ7414107.1 PhzF family phenazine biosynthesis protein [candidate division KSB1 bacterium]
MGSVLFYIVDVFAEERYSGNQLAVFRHAHRLQPAIMQRLAKEMNFSETTFIMAEEGEAFPVRIFTPATEVPFAGHPTLGTAFVIQQEVIRRQVPRLFLDLAVGRIQVRFEYGPQGVEQVWMRQTEPTFGPVLERGCVAGALGLAPEELGPVQPQVVSTGLPFIIVPVVSREALAKAGPTFSQECSEGLPVKAFLLFCQEPRSCANHLSVRVFAHEYGVPEDPATGSANGCLGAYLVHHRYFGQNKVDLRVEQGYEIGRPSLLLVRASQLADTIQVEVGGRVLMVAKGELV